MFRGAFLATAALLSASLSFNTISFGVAQVPFTAISNTRQEWYNAKTNWTPRPLTNAQRQKLTGKISLSRIQLYILPHFLRVRTPGSPGSEYVRGIITYILKDLLRWTVEYDTFVAKPPNPYPSTTFNNIIATHNPNARRRLVLACHYDSKITPRNFIGATDSAVPCSMLIEIAVAMRTYLTTNNDLTLQLIFFDGEEAFVSWSQTDSLYGSRHLAQTWQKTPWPPNAPSPGKTKLDSIDLLALLDLLGAPNPKFYNSLLVKSTNFNDLLRIEKSLNGGNTYFQSRQTMNYVEDDHIPFYNRNVQVLHVIPDPFPRHWHTLNDNARNLDMSSIKKLTDIIAVFVAEYMQLNIV